jgi:NADH-quinone oxidoreductase subunit N
MSRSDLASLGPELLLCGAGVLVLLLDAFAPRARSLLTPLSLAAVLAAAWAAWRLPAGSSFGGQLEVSAATFAFTGIVLVAALLALLASDGYLRREGILSGEYHALLLWCAVGLLLMLRTTELLTLFVSLELLSLCLYALAAYDRRARMGSEAGIKYFLMGAFVSAFVLLGVALLYGETGSTRLAVIADTLAHGAVSRPLVDLGLLLLVAGFGFKMSLVPFHAWSPDTYQGAPSPFVAFLSVAPKVASALVLVRVLTVVGQGDLGPRWSQLVALLAVLSMAVGNLLALVQRDVKRMLAYSGIAHMGYLTIALVSLNADSWAPVLVYLLAYALMNAGAFGVVAMLYPRPGEEHLISDLAGLGYRHPLLGGCLAVCMLSLGGIPPTLGFFGKYLVFLHAVRNGQLWLAVVGVIASLVGVFYYLRVVYMLYMRSAERAEEAPLRDGWGGLAAVLAAAGTLVLGIWPWGLLKWMVDALGGLS